MKIEDVIKSKNLTLSKKVIFNVLISHLTIAESHYNLLKPYDLSPEQFNVLRILRGQKGKPANMCVIQERMVAKTSNTTRLVDKLLTKGLVIREVCEENRRKMEVSITQKGLDLLAELDPIVLANEDNYTNKLTTEELETLNDLLEKLRD